MMRIYRTSPKQIWCIAACRKVRPRSFFGMKRHSGLRNRIKYPRSNH
jgi:hypothetical protein